MKNIIRTKKIFLVIILLTALIFGSFYSLSVLNSNVAYAYDEIYYKDSATIIGTSTETINYAYYDEEIGYANNYCPEYYNTNSNLASSCAAVAGSIIVGYYDRNSINLIPSFTPGRTVNNAYRYYPMTYATNTIQDVIGSLYNNMGITSSGATQTQYKNGLTNYVNNRGYNITYTNIMSNGSLNYNSAVTQMTGGKIASLMMVNFNGCSITMGSNTSTYTKTSYSGNHVFIAYGYRKIRYYDSNNNNFRTDIFLRVSTGFNSPQNTWYYVGSNDTSLVAAEVAYIY